MRNVGHPFVTLLIVTIALACASASFAQTAAQASGADIAAAQRQRAGAMEQEIDRFVSQLMPTLPDERRAAAQKLVEAKQREIAAWRAMADANQQGDAQAAAAAGQKQAAALSEGQIHFQHLKLLETRDRMAAEVRQLEAERANVPAALAELYEAMLESRRAASQKYADAAAAFDAQPNSVNTINAIGQAKGAEMESAFKRKAFLLNQQIVQFRQLAQQVNNPEIARLVEQLEQINTNMIEESRKELDAQWSLYQLQMQQQLVAAQVEQQLGVAAAGGRD